MSIITQVLDAYLRAQKKLIEFEDVDKNNCRVSLPLHYSAHQRVEVAITQLSKDHFLLTDEGQTVTELRNAGHATGPRVLERLKETIRIWNVDLDGVSLVRMCGRKDLGIAIHEIGEAAKTLGDAYLIAREKEPDTQAQETIKDQVRNIFRKEQYFYREAQTVPGRIEHAGHKVDFYIPPNELNGLAMEILINPNKLHAEAWGFRARDMKDANRGLLVGFVYDQVASDLNRTILGGIADIALPASQMMFFSEQLRKYEVSRGHA